MWGRGEHDTTIARTLGISRERVGKIRWKLGLPIIPRLRHCWTCGAAFQAESKRQSRCPLHRQPPIRVVSKPVERVLSTNPSAVAKRRGVQRRRAIGQCQWSGCGQQTRAPGTAYCQVHAEAMRVQQRQRMGRKKVAGLCISCKESAVSVVYCQKHLDASLYYDRRRKGKVDG